MGKMQFLEQFEVVSASLPDGGGGVLAHTIHRQDGGLGKGRRKKRAGRMGLMVLGEQDSAIGREAGKFVAYGLSQIELLAQPGGQRQQQKDDNQGNQPPFLFLLQKEQEFFAKLPHDAAEFIAALMAWQRQSRRQKANSLFKNVSFAA